MKQYRIFLKIIYKIEINYSSHHPKNKRNHSQNRVSLHQLPNLHSIHPRVFKHRPTTCSPARYLQQPAQSTTKNLNPPLFPNTLRQPTIELHHPQTSSNLTVHGWARFYGFAGKNTEPPGSAGSDDTSSAYVSSRRDKEKERKKERESVYVCTKRQLSSKWHSLGSTSMLRFSLRAIARKQRARARGVEKKLDGRSVESGREGEGRGSGEKRRERETKGNRGRREGASEGEERREEGWWLAVEVGVASPDARHILINTQTSSETGDPELRAIRWPFSQPLLESWGTDNRKWLSPPPSLPRGIRFAGLASRDSAFVITFNAPLPERERRISKLCRSLLADFFFF